MSLNIGVCSNAGIYSENGGPFFVMRDFFGALTPSVAQDAMGSGYTQMVANMLQGVEVRLGVNYLANKAELDALADRVIYTGPIDAYFDYSLGTLQYRSVRFETETSVVGRIAAKKSCPVTHTLGKS